MMRRTPAAPAGRRLGAIGLATAVALVAWALPATAQRGPTRGASTGLRPDVLGLACAPILTDDMPAVPLRISGGQSSVEQITFAPGELVTINAGTLNGITVGQEFYTRRPLVRGRTRVSRENPATIRTTGWIRVYAVDDYMSLATITHACETVDVGDYLEPFSVPVVPEPAINVGRPERDNYARVLMGQDARTSFGRGDYLLIDRGSNHGVTPGARFVFYHDKQVPGNFLFEVGEGVAVDIKTGSSTLRVMTAIDAILEGDYAGMRR